ncbi:hypothetical protein HII13_002017 [Brettanomyces bruxellensis]|nr:hypothetical protein HII13_002017 [Brettanomyces bruxellensis]
MQVFGLFKSIRIPVGIRSFSDGVSLRNTQECFPGKTDTIHPLKNILIPERLKVGVNTVLEDEIIRKLDEISPFMKGQVPVSKFPYIEMSDRRRVRYLPNVDEIKDRKGINEYIEKLTIYRYQSSAGDFINKTLLKIVQSVPEFLTKQSFLLIVLYFHFMVRDDLAGEIFKIMDKHTDVNHDVDFDNALLSVSLYNSNYIPRLKRLEKMKNNNTLANTNTWYYIFRVMHHISPKIKLLDMMNAFGISHKPILPSAIFCLSEVCTPEELLEYFERSGINENTMTPFQLNKLLRCYLKHERVNEAWSLINTKFEVNRKSLNGGSFVVFIDYFAGKRELYNCIAFNNLFPKRFNIKTTQFLAHEFLNQYLLHIPYFRNWNHLVHIMVYILTAESRNPTFLTRKTIDRLTAYAQLNGDENFKPTEYNNSDFLMRHKLFNNLRWPSDSVKSDFLPVGLDDQSTSFKEAASMVEIGLNKSNINPTDILGKRS